MRRPIIFSPERQNTYVQCKETFLRTFHALAVDLATENPDAYVPKFGALKDGESLPLPLMEMSFNKIVDSLTDELKGLTPRGGLAKKLSSAQIAAARDSVALAQKFANDLFRAWRPYLLPAAPARPKAASGSPSPEKETAFAAVVAELRALIGPARAALLDAIGTPETPGAGIARLCRIAHLEPEYFARLPGFSASTMPQLQTNQKKYLRSPAVREMARALASHWPADPSRPATGITGGQASLGPKAHGREH